MKVLVDAMNIAFMTYSLAASDLKKSDEILDKDNVGLFYHYFLNKINNFFTTYQDVIFCWEGKGSTAYRKSIFPDYKANRKRSENNGVEFLLKKALPVLRELLNSYPCKQIEVPECEGDDVIYSLCEKYKDEDITVLSSDGDLVQLIEFFPSVTVYNPVFKKYPKENKNLVIEKAICGDRSDNIPGLFRIGPKKLEKMMESKEEWDKVMSSGNNEKIYNEFLKIVDLRLYPERLKNEIKRIDEEIEFNKFDPESITKFLFDNKLKKMLDRWDRAKIDIWANSGAMEYDFVNKEQGVIIDDDDAIDNVLSEFV
jgi:5'-3' exonuclease